MLKYLIFSFLSLNAYSSTLDIVNADYKFQDRVEFKAIMETLKPFGGVVSEKSMTVTESQVKTLSRGEQAIEEAKARNRAILAEQNKIQKASEDKKEELSDLEKWKREEKETLAAWKKESKELLATWKEEQEKFLGRIKVYQENTFELPVTKTVIVEKQVPVERIPEAFIVNKSFEIPVRDQWNRPTCSAFAGARAVEILLAQNNRTYRLSPQYLYWASKPKCYTTPCTQKGSWITPAFRLSQEKATADIPTDGTCGYSGIGMPRNETQIPLKDSCREGVAKVQRFDEIKTLADTVEQIKKNIPVVMAAKLSPNFYKNQGLVTLSDSTKTLDVKLDSHSLGHAFLGVGVIELPQKIRATEGNYCIVIANSWGEGWGAGGYACLTENWLMKYRQSSPFVTVTKVLVK